jgi:hypothetical protein
VDHRRVGATVVLLAIITTGRWADASAKRAAGQLAAGRSKVPLAP